MTASPERLRSDALTLQALMRHNPGVLALSGYTPDLRRFVVDANLDAPVATATGWEILSRHRVLIEVPDNYLSRDSRGGYVKSRIRRDGQRIFHPNVWPVDGYFCFDDQFFPAKSLADQLVSALQIMQCQVVNHASPADWDADYYFLKNGDAVRTSLQPVDIRLPGVAVRVSQRSVPRLL